LVAGRGGGFVCGGVVRKWAERRISV